MKPFRSTTFFRDGCRRGRPYQGQLPRGYLRADTEFFTGKKSSTAGNIGTGRSATRRLQPAQTQLRGLPPIPTTSKSFPLPVTQELVKRGKERYEIFCSACHGMTGNGDGMIVRRGFRRAASFHDDRLRQAPVGHLL